MKLSSAKDFLKSIYKPLSDQEREEKAIQLAEILIEETAKEETLKEKKVKEKLFKVLEDDRAKAFLVDMLDQAFRSKKQRKTADQIQYLLKKYQPYKALNFLEKTFCKLFEYCGSFLFFLFVPILKWFMYKECKRFILPAEKNALTKAILQKKDKGITVNLNHLGEAILGEDEALGRLNVYLKSLENPHIDYISIKISTLYSQINLLQREDTLNILKERFRLLLRKAKTSRPSDPKFINLDMEEYKDLHLTVDLFKSVLSEEEFKDQSAGIVLQSYLPDSYLILCDLLDFAKTRSAKSIKIRLVKGANLAMEKVESALKGFEQAPFLDKASVDANFKKMLVKSLQKEHESYLQVGIGSHNLIDIAYALVLIEEQKIHSSVSFEMLDGMASAMQRVIHQLTGKMVLYCPAVEKKDFHNAIAYLIRRFDENSGKDNFLKVSFNLKINSKDWTIQLKQFKESLKLMHQLPIAPRREQNRYLTEEKPFRCQFINECDTDWTLPQNSLWAESVASKFFIENHVDKDPFNVDEVMTKALKAFDTYQNTNLATKVNILRKAAKLIRENRAELMRLMLVNTKKTIAESDGEISEAIDFIDYYISIFIEINSLNDLEMQPKGVFLVASPWNFSCSIPVGGIAACLLTGNTVIFKPAPEAVLVGKKIASIFYEAGFTKEVLQFVNCEDEPTGSLIIKHPLLSGIVLTGATETAKKFLKMNPKVQLSAETGGKNAIIVSELADRDLAIKDIVQSAFGYSGQKCSACSLVVCIGEVYKDEAFFAQLKDATKSLKVASPDNLSTKINPLIQPAKQDLLTALTTLEAKEEWVLKPEQDSKDLCLWSPGIKKNVEITNLSFKKELFGPLLSVVYAKDLRQAIEIVNQTPYGLTSGLHSLDEREHAFWLEHIKTGNCYINRGITGAIVQRQPFGGWKDSSFGTGIKAGGPNYLFQFMNIKQKILNEQSLESYQFYYKNYFSKNHDPSKVLGEKNILRYLPVEDVAIRFQEFDKEEDKKKCKEACLITKASIWISDEREESEEKFLQEVKNKGIKKVRFLMEPKEEMRKKLADLGVYVYVAEVVANGRIELLHYLKEQSVSVAYHRYGHIN